MPDNDKKQDDILHAREVTAPGAVVRHFKREIFPEGNEYLYQVIGTAHHSETNESLIVYKALYGEGKMCARPVDMFISKVDKEKYPDIKQTYRFEIYDGPVEGESGS